MDHLGLDDIGLSVMASEGPQTDEKSPVSPPPAYCWTDIQPISKNGNETSSHDAVLTDIKSLKKKSTVLAIILAIIAMISLVGLIIAICSLTEESDGKRWPECSKTKCKMDTKSVVQSGSSKNGGRCRLFVYGTSIKVDVSQAGVPILFILKDKHICLYSKRASLYMHSFLYRHAPLLPEKPECALIFRMRLFLDVYRIYCKCGNDVLNIYVLSDCGAP